MWTSAPEGHGREGSTGKRCETMPTVMKAGAAPAPSGNGTPSGVTRARVIEVPGYSTVAKREPLEIILHGVAGCGKTHTATTLPGPAAWVLAAPGATVPVRARRGLGRMPRIVARNFDEFTYGIESGPHAHKGFAAFAAALPVAIEWVVLDTLSSLLVAQHAAHLAEVEDEWEAKAEAARKRNKEPPGVDKFKAMDNDLNRARRVQAALQASGRNLLYLSHMSPMSEDASSNARSNTAGRPVVPGQFRTYLEAWSSAILHLVPDYAYLREDGGRRVRKVLNPRLALDLEQQPLVKHKWDTGGRVAPDLGALLKNVKEWPR